MSAVGLIFNSCLFDTWRGLINFESDRFGVMLCSADYVPDLKTQRRRADITDEVEAGGYKPSKVSVAILDAADDDDAIDISLGGARWARSNINARYAVYYHDNGGDPADDELVSVIDFGKNIVSSDGTFVLSESTLRIRNGS
jgi:hypothetical protein